jgi:3-deoxy-D-manno-octulosonate 8-phosphate phosphatase (KDO 8-P phosphatase)
MKPETELEVFSKLGGTFVTPIGTLIERMGSIRGLISDWDGVFNQGAKGEGAESTYSEPDSMGTNLLRYALWRRHRELPIVALITGAENPSARTFALREHFHAIYYGARNKTAAIEALCRQHRVSSEHFVCIFDDVNDLGMAFACGIRIYVQRSASPLLREYVVRQGLCDYVTAHPPSATPWRSASSCSDCSVRSTASLPRASPGIANTRATSPRAKLTRPSSST